MYEDALKVGKSLMIAAILVAFMKIYENSGLTNPVTLSVLVIVFCLWVFFRLELNEDTNEETKKETNNEQFDCKPPNYCCESSEGSSMNEREDIPIVTERVGRKKTPEKTDWVRLSKYKRLVKRKSRSRSNTPEHIP